MRTSIFVKMRVYDLNLWNVPTNTAVQWFWQRSTILETNSLSLVCMATKEGDKIGLEYVLYGSIVF